MKILEKDLHFTIREDQWSTQGLILKTDGWVMFELIDRKDGGDYLTQVATWQIFMHKYIESADVVYQQVAQYIKDELCSED